MVTSVFGYSMMKAVGVSMAPAVQCGAYLVIKRQSSYNVNDIVVVKHGYYGNIVKRIISASDNDGFYLAGDNEASLSVEQIGKMELSHIKGAVKFIVNPSRI